MLHKSVENDHDKGRYYFGVSLCVINIPVNECLHVLHVTVESCI